MCTLEVNNCNLEESLEVLRIVLIYLLSVSFTCDINREIFQYFICNHMAYCITLSFQVFC